MDWIDRISKWYTQGFWTADMIKNAVIKNKITQEEADKIAKDSK